MSGERRESLRSLVRPTLCDVLVVLTFLFVMLVRPHVTGYDVWWHLRTGLVLLAGEFPREDPFSYTAAGEAWVLHEWLAEVVMAWLYLRGGETGLAILRAGAAALTMGVLFEILVRRGVDVALSAALVGVALLLTLHAWVLRPLVFTTLLLAVVIFLTDEVIRRRRRWPAYLLPVVLLFWVNLHGGFVIGLAVMGVLVVVEAAQWAICPARRASDHLGALGVLCVGAVFAAGATLINPHGFEAILYPLSYLGEGKAQHQQFIGEWRPPTWSDSAGFFVHAAAAAAALVVSWRRLRPSDGVLAVLFLGLAISSRRHVVLCVVMTLPAVGVALQGVAAKLSRSPGGSWTALVARAAGYREIEAAPAVHAVALVAALCVAVPLIVGSLPRGPLAPGAGFPTATLATLRDAPAGRVFAQYRWGGYLLWEFPDRRVFIDGRLDVYPLEIYEQYLDLAGLRPGWRDVVDRYDVRYVLVQPHLAAASLPDLDPAWTEIARDAESILLAR